MRRSPLASLAFAVLVTGSVTLSSLVGAATPSHFPNASSISSDGSHVWVADSGSRSQPAQTGAVTEISAANGKIVRIIDAPTDGIINPEVIVSDHTHVWVLNSNDSITELTAASGALVRVIRAPRYGLRGAYDLVTNGHDVWVTNVTGNSVTEINALTGALVRIIKAPADGIRDPHAITTSGGYVWVSEYIVSKSFHLTFAITQLTTSGALVRVITYPKFQRVNGHLTSVINGPCAMSAASGNLWIDSCGLNLLELSATTGKIENNINTFSGVPQGVTSTYAVGSGASPGLISDDGTHLWGTLEHDGYAELTASTGGFVRRSLGPERRGSKGRAVNPTVSLTSDGVHLWVTGDDTNSVTEYNAGNGALVRIIK